MTVILNAPANAYEVVSAGVAATFSPPCVVGLVCNTTQEGNRRLLGMLYLYRRIADPSIIEFFAIEQREVRQRRTGIRFGTTLFPTDIVFFIPFYDFAQVIMVIQQSGA